MNCVNKALNLLDQQKEVLCVVNAIAQFFVMAHVFEPCDVCESISLFI